MSCLAASSNHTCELHHWFYQASHFTVAVGLSLLADRHCMSTILIPLLPLHLYVVAALKSLNVVLILQIILLVLSILLSGIFLLFMVGQANPFIAPSDLNLFLLTHNEPPGPAIP